VVSRLGCLRVGWMLVLLGAGRRRRGDQKHCRGESSPGGQEV
jgi:hypothetical protein